jgi:protein TonB
MSYNRWLLLKLNNNLRYPDLAAVSGIKGFVFTKFDILEDGSLGNVEILKSSGYKILDDEAVRHIKESVPFQPLPKEWGMYRFSLRIVTIFWINEVYVR